MDQLRLLTFGGLGLFVADTTTTGPATRRHRLALLALLAVAGERGLNRDKIQAFLWPESDTDRARHGLNQLMYFQRRHLNSEGLFLGRKTLHLNRALMSSDVWDFQTACDAGDWEGAVRVYAGPFLDGFFLKGAPEFERWATDQRRRLASQCERALAALALAAAAKGDQRVAVDWWRRAAELNPYDADTVLHLAEACIAMGDRAAAMRSVQHHEEVLRTDLGVCPDPRVARMIGDLRGGTS